MHTPLERESSAFPTDHHPTPTIIQPSTQPQKKQQPRKPKRKDTQVPQPSDHINNVADEAVHEELSGSFVGAATTASSLEAEQDSGNINKTQSKVTPNESSFQRTSLGGGPWCQETMGDTIAQTRFESESKHSNDSLLARGNTLQSDENSLKLDELVALCTTLQNRVLDLEKTKTTQLNDITSLKRRVKKLKKKNRSRTHRLKRLYKVGLTARVESSGNVESLDEDASKQERVNAIDADEEITLVNVQDDADKEVFDVNVLDGEEVFIVEQKVVHDVNDEVNVIEEVVEVINTVKLIIDAAQVGVVGDIVNTASIPVNAASAAITVNAATTTTTIITTVDDITLAQALEEIKSTKPKEKGIDIQEMGKEKIAGTELIQEITKKQKVKDDKETTKLKQFMEINLDEEQVAIDAIPLSVKSPKIVDWKIYKEGRKSYYQIMRDDEKCQMYMVFSQMLKSFDREDLEDLYKLVKAKYELTRPVEDLDLLLWGDLK
uniref:Uncharacterized protein n=1 Tax=Tanacetum cinerariifolium TaxID=118510 RepID=A0A6L2JLZ7_TANCI|nr:hypothetical protein [Tanacetum cinerariifolium]